MTAEQMFKELGYAKKNTGYSNIICYEKDASIRNLQHIIGTQFALNDEHVSMYSIFEKEAEFGAFNYLDVKLLNAINKQCKELGWLEEEKQKTREETNFEHFFEYLSAIKMCDLALIDGRVAQCLDIQCRECDFNGDCIERKFKWLKQPYKKSAYKLTQLEYDLISAYITYHSNRKFCDCRQLIELKDKGHFKNVDKDVLIKDILSNYEVVKDEKC